MGIGVVCHHQLAIFMILPMLWHYPEIEPFHRIACSLMLAAGISYTTGAYKFTLNTSEPGGFCRYKAVVVIQLVTIYYTRLYLWFTETYKLLQIFSEPAPRGSDAFFWGACIGCFLMSFFNMAMVGDATSAAIKWLPRKMPTAEEEKEELEKSKSNTSFAVIGRTMTGNSLGGPKSGATENLNQGPLELS